jgi:hypothetical protein
VDQQQLDDHAVALGVERPRRYAASDVAACRAIFSTLRADDEGFVVVDRYFNRLKIKQDSYFALARAPKLGDQELFEVVLGIRAVDEESLTRPFDLRPRLAEIRATWTEIHERVDAVYRELETIADRAAFARAAARHPFRPLLFLRRDGRDLRTAKFAWKDVTSWCGSDSGR